MPVSPDYAMLHLKPLETIIKFQNRRAFSIVFAARMRNYAPASQITRLELFAAMPHCKTVSSGGHGIKWATA